MNVWEFMKHAIGGGLVTAYGASKVEAYVKEQGLYGPTKTRVVGAGIGAVGGGVVGYFAGEQIADHERDYTLEEKVVSTAIGAAGGAAAGYVIGSYLAKKLDERDGIKEK